MGPSLLSDEIVYHEQQLNRLIRERQLIDRVIEHFQNSEDQLCVHVLTTKIWHNHQRYKVHITIKQMTPLKQSKVSNQISGRVLNKVVVPNSVYEQFIAFCTHNDGVSGQKKDLKPLIKEHVEGFQDHMWSALMLRARLDKRVERIGKGRATRWTLITRR